MAQLHRQVRIRIFLLSLLWIPLLGGFAWRCYRVQIQRHPELLEKAQERYTAKAVQSGKRGEIFDCNGSLLVGNEPRISISCSPYSCVYEPYERLENSRRAGVKESLPGLRENRRKLLAAFLSRHFNHSEAEFYERLAPFVPVRDEHGKEVKNPDGTVVMRKNQYLLLEREATIAFADQFKREVKALSLQNSSAGFAYKDIYVRSYPKGRLLANVLGFTNVVNDEDVAQSGLDRHLNSLIEPDVGQVIYERARDGSPLSYGIQHMQEGSNGHDIFLTVSEPIQSILEEELDAAYEKWKPDTLYAMIVDPRTGNILALAQRPNFDPNDRASFTPEGMGVRIATDSYEPGSVMKPFTIGAALDWGVVTPQTRIDCRGGVWYYCGKPMHDTHDYGILTVGGVIQKSSNIGTAKIALMMGDDRLTRMFKLFQFGRRTGLPFASESPGYVPKFTPYDRLAPTRAPIGYNVRVSPFQLVRGYCALANGGIMPELRIVDRIRDPKTGEQTRVPLKPFRRTFQHPETGRILAEMMIAVTQPGGTATQAAIPGYEVAGKTGTSRKYIPGRGYSPYYYASFVGFVPARNPRFVMLVTFDHPRGGSYGGTVAGPVFRNTMSRVLRLMNVPPDFPGKE